MIDSCVDYSTKAVLILAFVAPHFNELGFSSNFDLTLMSFCTQGLPRIAESTFQKVKQNHLLGVRLPSGRLRVLAKVLFPGTHPQSATILPLPEGEGNLMDDGFCDFALGSAQNDRVGGILRRVKVLGIEKPTIERN